MSAIETLMSCFCCGYYLKLYRCRHNKGTQTGEICENSIDINTAPVVTCPGAAPTQASDPEPFLQVTREDLKGMRKK